LSPFRLPSSLFVFIIPFLRLPLPSSHRPYLISICLTFLNSHVVRIHSDFFYFSSSFFCSSNLYSLLFALSFLPPSPFTSSLPFTFLLNNSPSNYVPRLFLCFHPSCFFLLFSLPSFASSLRPCFLKRSLFPLPIFPSLLVSPAFSLSLSSYSLTYIYANTYMSICKHILRYACNTYKKYTYIDFASSLA
jgi:hypothetical protein